MSDQICFLELLPFGQERFAACLTRMLWHCYDRYELKKLLSLNYLSTQKGITLIEALVSFAVGLIIVTAITIAVLSALVNSQSSKNRNLAASYAQQAMEILRQKRDSGSSFSNGSYCLRKDCANFSSLGTGCAPNVGTGCDTNQDLTNGFSFRRQVDIERRQVDIESGSGKCGGLNKFTVTVSWTDNKCSSNAFCNSVQLISCMADYTAVPTP